MGGSMAISTRLRMQGSARAFVLVRCCSSRVDRAERTLLYVVDIPDGIWATLEQAGCGPSGMPFYAGWGATEDDLALPGGKDNS